VRTLSWSFSSVLSPSSDTTVFSTSCRASGPSSVDLPGPFSSSFLSVASTFSQSPLTPYHHQISIFSSLSFSSTCFQGLSSLFVFFFRYPIFDVALSWSPEFLPSFPACPLFLIPLPPIYRSVSSTPFFPYFQIDVAFCFFPPEI